MISGVKHMVCSLWEVVCAIVYSVWCCVAFGIGRWFEVYSMWCVVSGKWCFSVVCVVGSGLCSGVWCVT